MGSSDAMHSRHQSLFISKIVVGARSATQMYLFSFTPQTNIGALADGSENIIFFAPPAKWVFSLINDSENAGQFYIFRSITSPWKLAGSLSPWTSNRCSADNQFAICNLNFTLQSSMGWVIFKQIFHLIYVQERIVHGTAFKFSFRLSASPHSPWNVSKFCVAI